MIGPVNNVEVTASALVKTGPGMIASVVLTPGTAAATLTLYDNTAASGTKRLVLTGVANGASVPYTPNAPIPVGTGIYAAISGSGATAYVQYV